MPNQTAPLDAARVRALLGATRFADVRYVSQTASTNIDAQVLLADPAALGATIVAEYQTAGAGRKGRRWFAPPGSALLFTTILPRALPTVELWVAPFWIALAVAAAVERSAGLRLDLVWPNDLHAAGGKVAGILSVARIVGDDAWLGCGVGINVHRPTGDSELASVEPQPVFVSDRAAHVERESLLAAILREFDASLDAFADPANVAARWAHRAHLPGTRYRYRRDSDGIERDGIAVRIGPQGALIVRGEHGEESIEMADVRIVGRG